MKRPLILITCAFALLGSVLSGPARAKAAEGYPGGVTFYLSGAVLDTHREPVREARLRVFVNGAPQKIASGLEQAEEIQTSSHGTYQIEFRLPPETAETARIRVEVAKTSYRRAALELGKNDFAPKDQNLFAVHNFEIVRILGPAFYLATAIFLLIYLVISFDLLHRTIAALLGAGTMLIVTYTAGTLNPDYHIISFARAISAIDMNVIFLLMGMMIIVGVLKHTGVFQWCAYQAFRVARGNIYVLSAVSCLFVAVTSAFLDNVTTMLLYTPVTIEVALALRISPLILLIPEVMASNVGGTATLIGDPPNIMIGSYAGLDFMDFIHNLTLVCILAVVALIIYSSVFYRKEYARARISDIDGFIGKIRDQYRITDRTLLGYGLFITGLAIALFISHGYWHMEVCIPALFGAGALFTYAVLTKKVKMLELIEKDIEWSTLLFFMFLFIVVSAVEETGLLALIADYVLKISQGNLIAAICMILWVSAIMSAFIDNIPFVATMLPITAYLTREIPGAESHVLWWALALGACLGGNGTLIGASANVVTMGIAEKAGHPIRFLDFMKYAFPYMLISVAICNVWLLIFY
ncbi:MAG: ArsB/NhaD family transporter [bacterium]|nr:ArsB/NhaD family transporter [bacterium]